MCNMTHSHVWYTHSQVWHDACIRVTWLISITREIWLNTLHAGRVTWLNSITRNCTQEVWHDMTHFNHTWNMTQHIVYRIWRFELKTESHTYRKCEMAHFKHTWDMTHFNHEWDVTQHIVYRIQYNGANQKQNHIHTGSVAWLISITCETWLNTLYTGYNSAN